MLLPSEIEAKSLIPAVRAILAKKLIREYSLKEEDVAKVLGITQAAVSNYVRGTRGDVELITKLESVREVMRMIDDIAELRVASDYRNRMRIRCSDVYQETGQLSGGNQQKVVLSKWLMTDPKVLILDEPTRGIDVGAKYEIYCIINELAEAGKGVVMISSEMPELLGVCDRICVMNDGAFVGEFAAAEATQERIMRAIMRNKVMDKKVLQGDLRP